MAAVQPLLDPVAAAVEQHHERVAVLYRLVGELGELGFDLDLTGFAAGEIAALTPSVQPEQESSAKEIDADGFLLGHRCPRCGMEFDDEKT